MWIAIVFFDREVAGQVTEFSLWFDVYLCGKSALLRFWHKWPSNFVIRRQLRARVGLRPVQSLLTVSAHASRVTVHGPRSACSVVFAVLECWSGVRALECRASPPHLHGADG